MAASGGGSSYRNGTYRGSLKVDRPLSVNSNPKTSVKPKPFSSSGPRRSSTGSIGASTGAACDDAGGEVVWFFFVFAGSRISQNLKFLYLVNEILFYPFSSLGWYGLTCLFKECEFCHIPMVGSVVSGFAF